MEQRTNDRQLTAIMGWGRRLIGQGVETVLRGWESVRQESGMLIAHGVRGGVVKRGTGYDFIGLEDVIEALGRAAIVGNRGLEGK